MSNFITIIAPGLLLKKEDVDLVIASGMDICALANVALDLAPDAKYCYASDGRWWEHHWPRFENFKGRMVTCEAVTAGVHGADGLEWVEHVQDYPGIAPKGKVSGTSSGEHVLHFIVNEGYDNIILLGYEYGAAGRGHYFGDHPTSIVAGESHWPTMIRNMGPLAARIAGQGVRVTNCTEVTALQCFKKAALTDALEQFQGKSAKTRRSARQDAA